MSAGYAGYKAYSQEKQQQLRDRSMSEIDSPIDQSNRTDRQHRTKTGILGTFLGWARRKLGIGGLFGGGMDDAQDVYGHPDLKGANAEIPDTIKERYWEKFKTTMGPEAADAMLAELKSAGFNTSELESKTQSIRSYLASKGQASSSFDFEFIPGRGFVIPESRTQAGSYQSIMNRVGRADAKTQMDLTAMLLGENDPNYVSRMTSEPIAKKESYLDLHVSAIGILAAPFLGLGAALLVGTSSAAVLAINVTTIYWIKSVGANVLLL